MKLSDFARYLRSIGDRLEGLGRSREPSQQRMAKALTPGGCCGSRARVVQAARVGCNSWAC